MVIGGVGQAFHFVIQPQAAICFHQLIEHFGEYGGQMRHIANGIVNLSFVQRTARPIGKASTFVQLDAQPQFNQIRIANLFALPQRHCRNLRIEQRVRGFAG